MRILLVQPDWSANRVGFTYLVRPEPLALEIIAACVPDHEVKILDLRVDATLPQTLASFQPQVVGITGMTADVPRMLSLCAEVKAYDPGIITVVGGYHATMSPEDFDLDTVDVIALGEGEITFRELVEALEREGDLAKVAGLAYRQDGYRMRTRPRPLIRRLDAFPPPARHLVDAYRDRYHFHFWENPYLVETTRGCPYRCIFCAVWIFHQGKCRYRAPETVLEELKGLGPVVCFVDDNFLQNLPRSERLARLLMENRIKGKYWIQARADSIVKRPDIVEKWVEVGLHSALIGFEKINDEELARVNKRSSLRVNEQAIHILQELGVDMWGAFIVEPSWGKSDFDALIDYVRSRKIVFPIFTIITPLPGTIFFQQKLRELKIRDYEFFDFFHSVLPTKLPVEEFYANMARLYASTTMGLTELKSRIRQGQIPVSALQRVRDLLKEVTDPKAYLRGLEPG